MVLASLKFTLETEQFEVVTCSSPVRALWMFLPTGISASSYRITRCQR